MSQEHTVFQVSLTFFVCAASKERAEEEILLRYGASDVLEEKVADAAVVAKHQKSVIHAHEDTDPIRDEDIPF